jgi:DNA-binding response OmpR family regulator
LRTWSRTLERRGLIVRTAGKVQQARQVLAGWTSRKFDYALVDDRLPDGFGLDLVPALSELRPAPGYAVVTARPSTERALRAWQKAVVIVPKPASPVGLLELLGFLETQRVTTRKPRYKREMSVLEPVRFGAFVLDPEGLRTEQGLLEIGGVGRILLAELLHYQGAWVPTVHLAREIYELEDAHGTMLVRRHISFLRRALGPLRWIVESAVQRGYRIAPAALTRNDG